MACDRAPGRRDVLARPLRRTRSPPCRRRLLATLHAAPGRLWLVRGKDVIEIPEIEDVGTGPSDNGRGTWTQAVIVTSHGESLPLMPYEKHGLLPHTVQDPTAIASEIRSVVFGA